MDESNPLTWRQDQETGKFSVFEQNDFDSERPLATFDTKQQADAAIRTRNADNEGLIMPFKDAETDFAKMSPEQQKAAIEGSTGSELERKKANEKRSGLQKIKDFGKTLGGIATNAYDAILASEKLLGAKQRDLLTFGGAEENLKKVKQQVISSMGKIENEYAQELRDNNIETSLVDVINKGELSKLPEAIGYNVANAIVSGLGAAFTGGYSMFAQTLAQDYKSGVENLAKETNRTPEQVIADGDDAELIPAISATIQGLIEKAQIGLASKAINSKGAYKYIRDLVVKNTGNSKWAKAAGAGLGLGVASLESGAQGAAQEVASIASEEAAGSDSFNKFYNKLGKTLSSEAGQKRLTESLVGEAIGAGGLIAGGRFGSRVLGERSPSAPPTQLGGIPTIPAPPNAPEFVPPVPPSGADQTTYETVTPEELQAFQQGQIDPERAAAIADDVALIQSGQMDINSIDDPNYRLMVESAMGAGQQEQQGGAAELSQINDRILTIKAAAQEGRIEGDPAEYAALKKRKAELESQVKTEEPKIKPQEQGTAIIPEQFQRPQITLSAPEITVSGSGNLFIPSLRKLGYTDEEISGMTMEQQQEIVSNRIEPARAADSSKVDVVKENAKQERLAEMNAELDREENPILPSNEQLPLADPAAQNMGTAVNQPLETGAAAVEVGESGRPVVEVEGDQVVEEEEPTQQIAATEQAEGEAEVDVKASPVSVKLTPKSKNVDYSYKYQGEKFERKKNEYEDSKGNKWLSLTQNPKIQYIASRIGKLFAPVGDVKMIDKKSGFFSGGPEFVSKHISSQSKTSNYADFLADRMLVEKVLGDRDRDNPSNTFISKDGDKVTYGFFDFGNTNLSQGEISTKSEDEVGQIGFNRMYDAAEKNGISVEELNKVIKDKLVNLKSKLNNPKFIEALKNEANLIPNKKSESFDVDEIIKNINKRIEKIDQHISTPLSERLINDAVSELKEDDNRAKKRDDYKPWRLNEIEDIEKDPLTFLKNKVKENSPDSYFWVGNSLAEYKKAIEELESKQKTQQRPVAEVKAETPKPKTKTQQITDLRAKEQAEYDAMSDPNDQKKRDEIYDRYDKLISPLLGEGKATEAPKVIAEIAKPFLNIDRLVAKGFVKYVDSKTGKPCAKFGMRDNAFSRGGQWEIIKDLKGYATHEKGGVDLTIDSKGVRMGGPDSKLYAADGLLMPGDGEPILPERKKQLAEQERQKFIQYMTHPSYKERLKKEVFSDTFDPSNKRQNEILEEEYARRMKEISNIPISQGKFSEAKGSEIPYAEYFGDESSYNQLPGGRKGELAKKGFPQIIVSEDASHNEINVNPELYSQVIGHELGHSSHSGSVGGRAYYNKGVPVPSEGMVEKTLQTHANSPLMEQKSAVKDLMRPDWDSASKKQKERIIELATQKIGPEKVRQIIEAQAKMQAEYYALKKEKGEKYAQEKGPNWYNDDFMKIQNNYIMDHLDQNATEVATRMIGLRKLAADKFGHDMNEDFDIKKYKDQIQDYYKKNNMIDEYNQLNKTLELSDDQINEMMKYIAKNNRSNGEVYG